MSRTSNPPTMPRHARRLVAIAALLVAGLAADPARSADPPPKQAAKSKRQLSIKDAGSAEDLMFLVNPHAPFEVRLATEDRRGGYVEGERFRVAITATAECYVTLLSWGPDGAIAQLVPSKSTTGSSEPLRLKAGERLLVPGGGAAFRAQPPHGETNLRVFATAQPLSVRLPAPDAAPPAPARPADEPADRTRKLRELLGIDRAGAKDLAVDDGPQSPLEGTEWAVADLWIMTGSDRADLASRMGVSEEVAVRPVEEAAPAAPEGARSEAPRERPPRRNQHPILLANLGSAASDEYLGRWKQALAGQGATKSIGTRFVAPPPLGGRQMPRLEPGAAAPPVEPPVELLVVRAAPPGSKNLGGASYATERVPLVPPGSKSLGSGDELLARRARELRSADPTVRAVVPDRVWQVFRRTADDALESNPFRGLQWHLHNQVKSGADIGWLLSAVDVVDLEPAVIGMVDQGIHVNDARLRAAIAINRGETPGNGVDDDGNGHVDDVEGWNFASDSAVLASGDDAFNHGSYCTSIIAGGLPRSSSYFFPVAYDSKVVVAACMAWNEAAGTAQGSLHSTLQAIEYAMRRGAKVVNLSLGGPTTWEELEELAKHPLFDELERQNVLLVIAAGNERIDIDREPVSPACLERPNTIVVMAVDPDGQPARAFDAEQTRWTQYSNWGRNRVHIAAPGTMILGIPSVDSTSYGDGTSYAAPIVAGVAAILMGKHPEWDVATVKRAILESARPVAGLEERCLTGGVVDLAAALGWQP